MTRTTILDIRAAPPSPGLLGGGIDVPAPGEERPDWALDVRGWAIGEHARAVTADGFHDGQRIWSVPIDVERAQTAREHPGAPDDRIGFHSLAGTLPLAPDFEVEVRAILEGGGHAPIGVIRGRRALLRASYEPRRNPVLLTTLGRTGSMLLMRMLAAHPEMLVYRPHRFEQRIASYWADLLLAIAEPASYIRQIAPPGDVDDPVWWLGLDGPMPWGLRDIGVQEWLGGDALESAAAVIQQRIDATYDCIVASTDTSDAALFAEKSNLRAAGLLTELYPGAREVFLVRDFRDMIASILSFNDKRGVQGFGRGSAASDEDYVASVGTWAHRLVRAWERRRGTAHLVRYEDLVLDAERTVGELLAYLGVSSDAHTVADVLAQVGEDLPELREHATSDGPAASVGRWQRDLAPELVDECERSFSAALEVFGYS